MKAAVAYGNGKLEYREISEPEIPAGYVKVAVKACGICGSDLTRVLARSAHSYPFVFGHEFSGIVTELGEGVTAVSPGAHIAGAPLIPCMECADCKRGRYSLCKQYGFIGSRQQGAFADYVVIPEKNAVKIDDGIPLEAAALFEPSTVALYGISLSKLKAGAAAAVIGAGTIGLLTLQWAKILGAAKIALISRDNQQDALAYQCGADTIFNTKDSDFNSKMDAYTNGRGFDFVYDAAGGTDTIHTALAIAGNRGVVCLIGTPKSELNFGVKTFELINRKELLITGSWMSYSSPFPGKEWSMCAQELARGNLRLGDDMFYKKFPMRLAEEAFNCYKSGEKIKGRILLVNN